MLNTRLTTYATALFAGVSFLLCVTFGLVVPEGYGMQGFLEIILPYFEWISLTSVILGLLQSLILGAYVGLVYVWIHNWLHRSMDVEYAR